jgi:RTX calcium-binding nonapeptide repeat (4 copies)
MAVVSTFLIGCAVLLIVVGCAGVGSEAPQKEQTHSPQATASEEARCQGTSTTESPIGGPVRFTTNDLPGCPKGGLLLGTDKHDYLNGNDGDDVIRGLDSKDDLYGGSGDDVIYAGPGGDSVTSAPGNDVIYGGDGNDFLWSKDGQRDKLYGGKGKDQCTFDKLDYVDSSCEKKKRHMPQV